MKELHIETTIRICQPAELPREEQALAEAARRATAQAYAPYSHFQVGAALLLADGTVVTGSNQENAAYPSGLCAERVALFQANHRFPDQENAAYPSGLCAERVALFQANHRFPEQPVKTLAIAAVSGGRPASTISPCGACRQVLLETEQRYGQHIRILLCGVDEITVVESAEALLPLCFGAESLGIG